jgi:hypothetical protein
LSKRPNAISALAASENPCKSERKKQDPKSQTVLLDLSDPVYTTEATIIMEQER